MLLDHGHVCQSAPALYESSLARWWTYGELCEVVSGLAEALESPHKALAFCFCRNDFASVTWYLAALEAGHAVALLDRSLIAEFKGPLVEAYRPDFILSSTATTEDQAAFGGHYASVEVAERHPANFAWRRQALPEQRVHPDLAVLLSTSGSTGSPKFVRLSRENVVSNASSICEALEIVDRDRGISSLPMHYSYGLSLINTHLFAGASMVLTNDGLMSPSFWNHFRGGLCTTFAGVPYSYQILRRLDIEQLKVPSLRVMTQAGGKLQNDSIAHFHKVMTSRNGRFYVMYGQTEATARITVLPSHRLPEKLGSVGLAIPGGSLAIRSSGVLTRIPNQSGELVYTGPNVMMGYAMGREQLADGDLLGGSLDTGDSAHFDQDGYVYIEGRMKRDAKLFGLRVNLDEVENLLRVHGPTAALAGNEKLVIFCEYGNDEEFYGYRQELAAKLLVHHSAFKFVRIEQLPRTSSGKINYPDLASRL